MMKALVKRQPTEGYELVELPIPVPARGELLVKVERVSICGSDINLFIWNDVAKQIATLPFTPGHECVGIIAGVGPDVGPEYVVGRRICVENHYYCGHCYQCTHGMAHICRDMGQFGHGKKTIHGGFSQYTIVPARYAYLMKTNLEARLACLLEPVGVAHHAVEEVEVKGDTLLITGCGPIGLFCIAIARALGARKIICSDVLPERLAIAKEMGADVAINGKQEDVKAAVLRETDGDGAGAWIEASGANSIINEGFTMLRKGGRVLLLGVPKAAIHVDNPLPNFIFKSIVLKTIHGRKIFHTWEQSEHLLHSGRVDVRRAISHELPMGRFVHAHRELIAGRGCKIIVDPQDLSGVPSRL